VNDLVTTLNSDNVLCATFGLNPSYVAGILNSVNEIDFYVLCNKQITLNILGNLLREKSVLLSYLQKTDFC